MFFASATREAKTIYQEGLRFRDNQIPERGVSYVATWSMVKKAGNLVNIELRPHDLRRHAATHASRSGTRIVIMSDMPWSPTPGSSYHLACSADNCVDFLYTCQSVGAQETSSVEVLLLFWMV